MNKITKIAVLGGGGRTGQYLISQLIEKGYSVKVLLRNPEAFQITNPLIEIVHGDALNVSVLNSLIEGCQAVISTIGQRPGEPLVAEQTTRNVLAAMIEHGITRYILVAGINVDTTFDQKGPDTIAATNWMKTNFPVIQEDRQKAYALLTRSAIKWTLVRVPFINFSKATTEVEVALDDCLGSKIDAGNIAAFLIRQLHEETYFNTAPFIWNA
ncbi:MAG: NAD(P)H-binding protein [Bacteroidota bacterium]